MRNALTFWRNEAFRPLSELQREIDRLFADYLPAGSSRGENAWFNPACDVEEESDHFLIKMDVPGVSKDDIKIESRDGELTISGERKFERKEKDKDKGVRVSERSYGSFFRSFTLPAGIDPDKIEAHYENGVLMLTVPKAASAKPKQIAIGTGKGMGGKLLDKSA